MFSGSGSTSERCLNRKQGQAAYSVALTGWRAQEKDPLAAHRGVWTGGRQLGNHPVSSRSSARERRICRERGVPGVPGVVQPHRPRLSVHPPWGGGISDSD